MRQLTMSKIRIVFRPRSRMVYMTMTLHVVTSITIVVIIIIIIIICSSSWA